MNQKIQDLLNRYKDLNKKTEMEVHDASHRKVVAHAIDQGAIEEMQNITEDLKECLKKVEDTELYDLLSNEDLVEIIDSELSRRKSIQ